MRALLLATAVLLAAPLAPEAAAQTSFGLKGGLNTSFFGGDDAGDSEPRLGFVGGAVLRSQVNPGFALQAEVLYSQKGDVLDRSNAGGGDITTELDYIEIPVMARVSAPLGLYAEGGVSVGGYVGLPVRAEVVDEVGFLDEIDARTDYGVLLGVDAGSGPYYVEGRYALGLAKPIEFDSVLGTDPELTNQTVSITFGVRFGGRRY